MVRQLITRIEDGLHDRLKARARTESLSVNELVKQLLRAGLSRGEEEARVRARLLKKDLHVVPPISGKAPSRDAAIRATLGAGRAASEALAADRAAR